MNRDKYIGVCEATAAGKSAFVRHSSSSEEGVVQSCTHEHLLVKTSEGKERCWDYHDCDKVDRSR